MSNTGVKAVYQAAACPGWPHLSHKCSATPRSNDVVVVAASIVAGNVAAAAAALVAVENSFVVEGRIYAAAAGIEFMGMAGLSVVIGNNPCGHLYDDSPSYHRSDFLFYDLWSRPIPQRPTPRPP